MSCLGEKLTEMHRWKWVYHNERYLGNYICPLDLEFAKHLQNEVEQSIYDAIFREEPR